jgi:pyrimidine operon attenuation protein/uracil phosphoribosyltransferase
MQTKAQIMDATGMQRSITRMAHEILERNKGLNGVILVGIQTRGAVLADRVADKLLEIEGSRPQVRHLDPRPYRDDIEAGQVSREPVPGLDIKDKVVVLVDDVLYTGRTVRAALDAMLSTGRARVVQLAALIDRGHRELPIRADFVGKNVPTARDEAISVHLREVDEEDGVWIVDDNA